jgi:putative transposase
MKPVCEALGVARSNVAAGFRTPLAKPKRPRGRPPAEEEELLASIRAILADQPAYGYRRMWALLRRAAEECGAPAPNHKRVHRVMKAYGLLLARHAGGVQERRHDGKIAVDRSNTRWCSDGFEIACDDGDKVRVAFALDCHDREAMAYVATTEGIKSEDVRDLMVASVESRFGRVNRLRNAIEWLSDNGSGYVAKDTRRFAHDLDLEPVTTPVQSPQSNGMAEAFVRTFKRDYVRLSPLPDARAVLDRLPAWFRHYNEVHPHSALGYRAPREFVRRRSNPEAVSGL